MERIETEFKNLPTHKISYQNNENANPKQAKYMPITDDALAEVDKHRNQVNASQREKQSSHNGRVSSRQTSQPRPHTYVADTLMTEANPFTLAQLMSKSHVDMSRHPSTNYSDTEMPAWARLFLIDMDHQMDKINDKLNQNLDEIKQMNRTLLDELKEDRTEFKQQREELKPTICDPLEQMNEESIRSILPDQTKETIQTTPDTQEIKKSEQTIDRPKLKGDEATPNQEQTELYQTTTKHKIKRHKKKRSKPMTPKKMKKREKRRERKRKKKKRTARADATGDATTFHRPASHRRMTKRPERMEWYVLAEQEFIRHQGKWSPWVEETTSKPFHYV